MMSQIPLFTPPLWTVSELTHYLRGLIESDHNLQELWVHGEVSNLSRPSSGHLYFTIKDRLSALRCVMWRNIANRQPFIPQDGQAIEVHGNINVYEVAGQYQLYADKIRPAGEGILYQEFLRLKARLEEEGLFDPQRKRAITPWPRIVGIVTSPTGAALRDILHTLERRYPIVRVVLAATPVQGDDAPQGIVAAIQALNRITQPDVILVARGGGSIEDLWAFNDEQVARAIASSNAPVISGVGHETDFTISDFVCDLRAPTPTAAAELATPNQADLVSDMNNLAKRIARATTFNFTSNHSHLYQLKSLLSLRTPLARIRSDRQYMDNLEHRTSSISNYQIQIRRAQIVGVSQNLGALNPLAVLQRGYAAVLRQDGVLIRRVDQVAKGDALTVRVSNGQFGVLVENTITEE